MASGGGLTDLILRCLVLMDYLVLENVLLAKKEQPKQEQNDSLKNEFKLDY